MKYIFIQTFPLLLLKKDIFLQIRPSSDEKHKIITLFIVIVI